MTAAPKNKKSDESPSPVIENRKARFEYQLGERFEAGIQLLGSEVKAVREGKMNLQDSYVRLWKDEVWIYSCHISPYSRKQGHEEIDPLRTRKLLLNRSEINKVSGWIERRQGVSVIPTKAYFKHGRLKIEVALAQGKKQYDKRETIKKRMQDREARAAIKNRSR